MFIFSPGKENLPPIMTTPRHSIDSSSEQILPGKKLWICFQKRNFLSIKSYSFIRHRSN